MRKCVVFGAVALLFVLSGARVEGVTLGQADRFSTNDPLGWTMGPNAVMLPIVISTGGPQGANDGFLEVISTGTGSANSKMIMFNASQWTGDYIDTGVTRINLDMANFGTNPLSMRVAFQDNFGAEFSSTIPIPLPADGGMWHSESFDLSPSAFTKIQGTSTATQALQNVGVLRLLSSANPSFMGDTIAATAGFDNITAVPEPGVGGMIIVAIAVGMRRRQR
jgi:hypothetical protein